MSYQWSFFEFDLKLSLIYKIYIFKPVFLFFTEYISQLPILYFNNKFKNHFKWINWELFSFLSLWQKNPLKKLQMKFVKNPQITNSENVRISKPWWAQDKWTFVNMLKTSFFGSYANAALVPIRGIYGMLNALHVTWNVFPVFKCPSNVYISNEKHAGKWAFLDLLRGRYLCFGCLHLQRRSGVHDADAVASRLFDFWLFSVNVELD